MRLWYCGHLSCSDSPSQVVLSDLPEVGELAERNIQASSLALASSVKFAALNRRAPIPSTITWRTYDIILASECRRDDETIQASINK